MAVLSCPGAVTTPVIVVRFPLGRTHCRLPRPRRVLLPHSEGVPPPPQIWGAEHIPQLVISPPHPSGHGPQLTFAGQVVAGIHVRGMLHTLAMAMPQV